MGDFGKFALLRALGEGRAAGVCWYLTSGEGERAKDGRHTSYLDDNGRFEHLDSALFHRLRQHRDDLGGDGKKRSVAGLERLALLLPGTKYHRALVPPRADRGAWTRGMVAAMRDADLVLLDPDNGIEGDRLTHKSAAFDELVALRAPGRTLVLYHHQTRFKGGAVAEVAAIRRSLRAHAFHRVEAIRLRPYSSRFYFVLDASPEVVDRLRGFVDRWGDECVRFPIHG